MQTLKPSDACKAGILAFRCYERVQSLKCRKVELAIAASERPCASGWGETVELISFALHGARLEPS